MSELFLLLCQNVVKIRSHSVDNLNFDITSTKSTKEIIFKIRNFFKRPNFVEKSKFCLKVQILCLKIFFIKYRQNITKC